MPPKIPQIPPPQVQPLVEGVSTPSPFSQKIQGRQQRREKEMDLWHQWKGGNEEALEPLFQSLTPLMRRAGSQFRGNLPDAYVDSMVKKHTLDALKTYDPELKSKRTGQGVQLNTHIMNRMQKVKRDVSQYQNPGRLAESSHWNVPGYQNVHSNLSAELGRDPTYEEVGDVLGETPEEVARLQAGTRRDLASVEGQNRWKAPEGQAMQGFLEDYSHELDPLEKSVLYMTFGMKGYKPMQAKDIAGNLGLTQGRVSQIRSDVASGFEKFHGSKNTEPTTH